jgi:YlmC/YmxH family sporulation protein
MYRAGELRQKEVINIQDASRLGYVSDVEVSLDKGEIEAIVVPGKMKLFRFGKNDDLVILWSDIKMIGEEVILVDIPPIKENKLKK